jgi:hypothetical protein
VLAAVTVSGRHWRTRAFRAGSPATKLTAPDPADLVSRALPGFGFELAYQGEVTLGVPVSHGDAPWLGRCDIFEDRGDRQYQRTPRRPYRPASAAYGRIAIDKGSFRRLGRGTESTSCNWCGRSPFHARPTGAASGCVQARRLLPMVIHSMSSDRWRVSWLRACPRAISYRAALRGDQGSAHTAACGR